MHQNRAHPDLRAAAAETMVAIRHLKHLKGNLNNVGTDVLSANK
jgi:hypothetical protein